MTSIPLTLSLAPFPTGSSMNADEFGQQLIANLSAVLNGNLVLGQTFGTMPTSNIGPWFDGTKWMFWSDTLGAYTDMSVQVPVSTIHNGRMQVWQRGITFPAINGAIHTADRYVASETMITGVASVSQHAINYIGSDLAPNTAFSLRITVTTPQPTVSVDETFAVYQRVERSFTRPLFDQPSSLSLVLQCSVIGTYCVTIRDSGTDWSYVQECVITTPNVPQAFSFPNIPTFPTNTGNWGTNETDACYSITVCAASGATYQTPPNIWTVGNFLATENQDNLFATMGNTMDITLIQHEPGLICNPFLYTPFDEDLRKCQRYYCQSYDYGIFPGAITGDASGIICYAALLNNAIGFVRYPQPMRAAPAFPASLQFYSGATGLGTRLYDNISSVDRFVTSCFTIGKTGFANLVATGLSSGNIALFHYTATADL